LCLLGILDERRVGLSLARIFYYDWNLIRWLVARRLLSLGSWFELGELGQGLFFGRQTDRRDSGTYVFQNSVGMLLFLGTFALNVVSHWLRERYRRMAG